MTDKSNTEQLDKDIEQFVKENKMAYIMSTIETIKERFGLISLDKLQETKERQKIT